MKTLFSTLAFLMIASTSFAQQETESFESGYAIGGTQFSHSSGTDFLLEGNFRIVNLASYGVDESDWFIDTGALEGNGNQSASAITILQNPTHDAFILNSFYAWTSSDDGNFDAVGDIIISATSWPEENSLSTTLTISPTGLSGNDYYFVDLAGTVFENTPLNSLTITMLDPINYIALDDINYTAVNTSTAINSIATQVYCYPNPIVGELKISGLESNQNTLKIYSSVREIVHTSLIKENERMDLSHLEPGIYMIEVLEGNKILLKERVVKI